MWISSNKSRLLHRFFYIWRYRWANLERLCEFFDRLKCERAFFLWRRRCLMRQSRMQKLTLMKLWYWKYRSRKFDRLNDTRQTAQFIRLKASFFRTWKLA
ncbi:hypothetical protein BC829DRAFT_405656, partial [Chytridium lagenaria]